MSELRALTLKSKVKAVISCPGCRLTLDNLDCELSELESLVARKRLSVECPNCIGIGEYPFIKTFVDETQIQYEKALQYLAGGLEADYESKTLCSCGTRGGKSIIHTIDDYLLCDKCGLMLLQVGRLKGGNEVRQCVDQRHFVAFKKFQHNMYRLERELSNQAY